MKNKKSMPFSKSFPLVFRQWKCKLAKSPHTPEERGMALILTLGVLTIIIVLAMGFVASSITAQKAAVYENNVTIARMLADSAVQRAIGAMRFYSTISSTFSNVKSHNESDSVVANRKNHDFIYKLNTNLEDMEYSLPDPYNPNDTKAVHWQYVYNGLSGSDKRIIGRVAYVTVVAGGKLDPSACVTHDATGTAVNENGANEERPGREINEINIANLDPTNSTGYLSVNNVADFSSDHASGTLPDGMRWPDFETMFSSSRLNITNGAQQDQYHNWFELDASPEPEAFWLDDDADGIKDGGELYHRFNMARTDWSSVTVSDILSSPDAWSDSPSTNDGKGIPWLKNWTDNSGIFPDAETRSKQIAANIIDYCDSDDAVTTDDITDPTYMGLERTPYINEIGLDLDGYLTVTDPGDGSGNKLAVLDLDVQAGVELINIYGDNFDKHTQLHVFGDIEFDMGTDDGGFHTGDMPFEHTFDADPVGTHDYKFTWDVHYNAGSYSKLVVPPIKAWIIDVRVGITKAFLIYDGQVVDALNGGGTHIWHSKFGLLLLDLMTTHDLGRVSWEAKDPRNNLYKDDWIIKSKKAVVGIEPYPGTSNAANHNTEYDTAGDAEGTRTPSTQSTYFIRNGPMQSPWELGFIHRGGLWETLNIDTYNDTVGVSATVGGGAYADGDANILDQIKMTSNVETYGKVNLNSTNSSVLKALIANVYAGVNIENNGDDGIAGNSDDDNPGLQGAGGNALDYNTDVTHIADEIKATTTSGTFQFTTRGEIAKIANLSDGSEVTQNTDAKKEEIIGKLVNLTKAAPLELDGEIYIIAIAQAIRDIGGGATISRDMDQDGVIGNADETVLGDDINGDGDALDHSISETISGCTFGTYDQYADEIIAEQKVVAIVYRDPSTARWKIKKMYYLDD